MAKYLNNSSKSLERTQKNDASQEHSTINLSIYESEVSTQTQSPHSAKSGTADVNGQNGSPTFDIQYENKPMRDDIKRLTAIAAERLTQVVRLTTETTNLLTDRTTLVQERDQQKNLADEYQTLLKTAEEEKELLLLHLHLTQEELEENLIQSELHQSTIELYRQRLARTLERNPTYWDFEDFDARVLEDTSERHVAQWHFRNVDIGGCLVPELHFKTVRIDGVVGIIIQRSHGLESSAPFLRWPGISLEESELLCMPVKGAPTYSNNAVLSNLGPTDWKTLKVLVQRLSALLIQPNDSRLPDKTEAASLHNGLVTLDKVLSNWPNILRYDEIRIDRTFEIDGYHALEIKVVNPQLGEQVWPDFSYRIATVFETGQPFNQNPRLEFPKSDINPLESWFAECNDERGPRLELRFAQPDVMDINVWNVLAGNDRLLVAALLASTNAQLAELEHRSSESGQRWQDWLTVGESMRRILAKVTARPSSSQGA